MLFLSTLSGNLVEIVITLTTILILYYKWSYQYWKKRNMPHIEPTIPFGTLSNPFIAKENNSYEIKLLYQKMKNLGWKHAGLYSLSAPSYMPIDLEYVKNVMTKDFQYFTDRGFYYNEKDDPLSAHLFAVGGTKWRNLRTKLTPTFTSGKMKMMFQTLLDCTSNLLDRMEEDCRKTNAIDIKEVLACFTTDIIGSCAFGLDCNTFKEENSPFREYGKKSFAFSKTIMAKIIFAMTFPKIARYFSLKITQQDVTDFFIKLVKDSVDYRQRNNITRKDFLQLLIDLKSNNLTEGEEYSYDGKTLTIEEMTAQCFAFFFAGFETSSTTMTFVLYELASREYLQQKIREEIECVLAKHDGKITYEAIQEMKYMDQVINETLRMYPPLPLLTRKCVKDYKLLNEDVVIEKGTMVVIPILAIHHDKDYYPDPDTFDPERFSDEMKSSRHSHAFIPFGEGPRICIGMRFGLMQSKVGLATLLKNYKFTVNKKTQEPLKMKPNTPTLSVQGEIWLNAEKL